MRAENLRLRTLNQNYAERQRLSVLQNFHSIDEFLSGRQELYSVLEELLQNKETTSDQQIAQIISLLKERTGAYGT